MYIYIVIYASSRIAWTPDKQNRPGDTERERENKNWNSCTYSLECIPADLVRFGNRPESPSPEPSHTTSQGTGTGEPGMGRFNRP